MVSTTDLPPTHGNPSTKSIAMSLHTLSSIGSGYRSPARCRCSVLFLWQTEQLRMKSWTNRWRWALKKDAHSLCKVFWAPSCPAAWASWSSCFHNVNESGTKRRPLNSSILSNRDQPSGTISMNVLSLQVGAELMLQGVIDREDWQERARTAGPSPSRRDSASATMFSLPGLYSTERSYLNSLDTHVC